MLDRKTAPEFKTIEKINIQPVEKFKLDNGMDVFILDAGTQEIIRIEFIFDAGMYFQDRTLIATTTNSLLECGTEKLSADELSEALDFYGSFFECSVGQYKSNITLFSLNKYLENSLVLVEDMIKNSVFPENELKLFLDNKKQTFLVNSKKVDIIARRRFSELLFGEKHPYGINAAENDFDTVTREMAKSFYKKFYHSRNCSIIVAGKTPKNILEILNRHFGTKWGDSDTLIKKDWVPAETSKERKHFILKEDAMQSAIKIGRILFDMKHQDNIGFSVLNTILGGYFGSRLMTNIREDKGYTYGIGSGLIPMVHTGYFSISTEVGSDVTQNALDEIYKEIKKLREEKVGDEELETVKNYLLGSILSSTDGAFALADKFKGIWQFDMGYDYYDKVVHEIKTIKPDRILSLANQYLQEKDLIELVVGKK